MKFGAWAILLPKFYYAEQEPHSSLLKVTRSMTPEISSVAGRRSGIAAVISGDSILPRMDGGMDDSIQARFPAFGSDRWNPRG